MFNIIKDCSPYYILFTHQDLEGYTKLLQDIATSQKFTDSMNYCVSVTKEIVPSYQTKEWYPKGSQLDTIIDNNPCTNLLNLSRSAAYLTTLPGVYSPIHVDNNGQTKQSVGYRINYPVFIKDNQCITSWYSGNGIVPNEKLSFFANPELSKPKLLESTSLAMGQIMLINTAIFHSWDNSQSINDRTIIGLRDESCDVSFDEAKKNLFGI
jgi:hypothetical protein